MHGSSGPTAHGRRLLGPAPDERCVAPPPVEAGTLEQTAESLARTRLWGLDCAAEVKIWRTAREACQLL